MTKDIQEMVTLNANMSYCHIYIYWYLWQVIHCDTCQRTSRKLSISRHELNPVPVVSPWYHIGMDLIGPISPMSHQGNKYIMTLSDYFTKFVEAIPIPDKEAATICKAIYKV